MPPRKRKGVANEATSETECVSTAQPSISAASSSTEIASLSSNAPDHKKLRPSASAASDDVVLIRSCAPSADPQLLDAWCASNGIYKLHLCHGFISPESGQGLIARQTIQIGEQFLSVPVECIITQRKAEESEIGKAVISINQQIDAARGSNASAASPSANPLPQHRISSRTMLYLYLIHARLTPSCFFYPWLTHGVPRHYSSPLNWTDSELTLLKGTNLGEAVPHRLRQLRSRLSNALPALQASFPQLFPSRLFHWDNFLWAHETYSSRGFPAQLADPSLAPLAPINPHAFVTQDNVGQHQNPVIVHASSAASPSSSSLSSPTPTSSPQPSSSSSSRRLGCLIPYVDLTNHRYRYPITWIHASASANAVHPHDRILSDEHLPVSQNLGRVVFQAGARIEAGQEVLNNYGAKANEEFLMGYGFTLRDNPADELTVAIGARGITPEKMALIRSQGLKLSHVLSLEHTPSSLEQVLRISLMNERELQSEPFVDRWIRTIAPSLLEADCSPTAESSEANADGYVSSRNELLMLQTLRSLLFGRLVRLQSSSSNVTSIHETYISHSAADSAAEPPASSSSKSKSKKQTKSKVAGDSKQQSRYCKRVTAKYFQQFQDEDIAARSANQSSDKNYHIECAYNYKLGQRAILMQAIERIDQKLEEAVGRIAVDARHFRNRTLKYAARASSPAAMKATSKTATSVDDQSARLAFDKWLESNTGYLSVTANATEWCVPADYDPRSSSESDDSYDAFPVLLDLPMSIVISTSSFSTTPSFRPLLDGNSDFTDLPDEAQLVLFLLHERSKGEASVWNSWIDLVWRQRFPSDSFDQEQLEGNDANLIDLFSMHVSMLEASGNKQAAANASWDEFIHAAGIVQAYCVQFISQGGQTQKALLPVPFMPTMVSPLIPLTRLEMVHEQSSNDTHLTLRSLVPLKQSDPVCLSFEVFGANLLSIPSQMLELHDSHSSVEVSFESILDALAQLLSQQGEEGESMMEEDEEGNNEDSGFSFGLPLRAVGATHQAVWRSMNIDPSTSFHLSNSFLSQALKAVVRTFFLTSYQLQQEQVAPSSSPASSSNVGLSGQLVDDSDEEDEETTSESVKDSATSSSTAAASPSSRSSASPVPVASRLNEAVNGFLYAFIRSLFDSLVTEDEDEEADADESASSASSSSSSSSSSSFSDDDESTLPSHYVPVVKFASTDRLKGEHIREQQEIFSSVLQLVLPIDGEQLQHDDEDNMDDDDENAPPFNRE